MTLGCQLIGMATGNGTMTFSQKWYSLSATWSKLDSLFGPRIEVITFGNGIQEHFQDSIHEAAGLVFFLSCVDIRVSFHWQLARQLMDIEQ